MEDARVRRWHRISELAIEGDELRELRAAVVSVCAAPHDPIARQHLRMLTDGRALHDQAIPLLSVEARTQDNPVVLAALRDEARHVCDHVDRPVERLTVLEEMATREPDNAAHIERLAWMYYLVGAWVQAAQALEQLAPYVVADQALVILRAAGRLYRNSGRNDRALIAYRAVALRKPSDLDALMALADLMVAPTGEPDGRFNPQPPPTPPAAVRSKPAASQSPPAKPVAPVAPVPEHSSPVVLTNRQAAQDAHDLFASLEDNEIEGSLAFAFGDEDNPFRELAEPPEPPPKKPSRQTRERDGLLRPPAQQPVVSQPIAAPAPPTIIGLDDIVDEVNLDEVDFAEPAGRSLDSDCGALRALANAAEQRGDRVRAIDYFERLLVAQRARGEIRESAETCELLARRVTDDQRRQLLAEEAIAAYETAGDSERADELAIWASRFATSSR